jgi:hypothetical protein
MRLELKLADDRARGRVADVHDRVDLRRPARKLARPVGHRRERDDHEDGAREARDLEEVAGHRGALSVVGGWWVGGVGGEGEG